MTIDLTAAIRKGIISFHKDSNCLIAEASTLLANLPGDHTSIPFRIKLIGKKETRTFDGFEQRRDREQELVATIWKDLDSDITFEVLND